MTRPALITAGIVIILFVMGVWVYLMAYGAPKQTSEVFTNLGIVTPRDETVRTIDALLVGETAVSLALGGSELQQLTTRAVAGFAFVGTSSSLIRYAERGTGYIYEIDLSRGTERQISLITLPQAAVAVFSPSAHMVAITTYEGYGSQTVVLPAENDGGDSVELVELPQNAENIAFEDNETLYVSLENTTQTVGYAYDLTTLARSELFTVSLIDLKLHWGNTVTGIFAQTKPSRDLEGYLYEVKGNTLIPVGAEGFGLTAIVHASEKVISRVINSTRYSSYALIDKERYAQAVLAVPEKCTFDTARIGFIWCAAPLAAPSDEYLEMWYQGAETSLDNLWLTELEEGSGTLVANLAGLSGRTIDVANITIDATGSHILLSNKLDGALWLYTVQQ